MDRKPNHEELERRFKELERENIRLKDTEEMLRESEERYKLLAENVSDVIWTVDANQQFVYVSPSVERLLGYSVEESLGQHLSFSSYPITYCIRLTVFL